MKNLHDLSADELNLHRLAYGGWNDFPPAWRELTEEQFAKSMFFTYTPVMHEFRQMLDRSKPQQPAMSATLYHMHDGTGFSIVNDFWAGKVRFYTFGCDHEYGDASEELRRRGIRLHQGEHAGFCKKCGHLRIVDSSD